ncbi:MAG TPA: hypothetical protein VJV74_05420 [Terriglobia bacterium]|nr:hypothetical protein [Terriglobia bacterium]
MIAVILALLSSLGQSKGGKIGELLVQLAATFQAAQMSYEDFTTTALPWITWANAITDADRDPTADERSAYLALAAAVNANIESLGSGGPAVPIPPPPP